MAYCRSACSGTPPHSIGTNSQIQLPEVTENFGFTFLGKSIFPLRKSEFLIQVRNLFQIGILVFQLYERFSGSPATVVLSEIIRRYVIYEL